MFRLIEFLYLMAFELICALACVPLTIVIAFLCMLPNGLKAVRLVNLFKSVIIFFCGSVIILKPELFKFCYLYHLFSSESNQTCPWLHAEVLSGSSSKEGR